MAVAPNPEFFIARQFALLTKRFPATRTSGYGTENQLNNIVNCWQPDFVTTYVEGRERGMA